MEGMSTPTRAAILPALVLAAAVHAAVWPGTQPDGSVLLPNQWSLRPVGTQVELGDFPVNVAVHPDGRFAAVLHAGYGPHQVHVVDLGAGKVVAQARVEEAFYGIEFTSDGRRLFCSGAGTEVVRAFDFDAKTGELGRETAIPLRDVKERGVPAGLAVSGDATSLYVANVLGHRVAKVDLAARSNVLEFAFGAALTGDATRVYGAAGATAAPAAADGRRDLLRNLASLPVLGLFGWAAASHKRTYGVDVVSGATIKVGALDISQLKGELPKGRIKDHEISRLICGGNLIGGWAHSRDLIYAPSLFKAYNTEPKIFETLMLAERAGINAINIGFPSNPVLEKYKKLTGSRIKVISQIAPGNEKEGLFVNIDKAIDHGVDIIQVQGNHGDWLVRDGRIDDIAKMLEHIRKQGYTAGLGAHSVETLFRTQEAGILPDYYMKTMHHDRYWSAHPKENRVPFEVDGKRHPEHDRFHDNLWCLNPERTA